MTTPLIPPAAPGLVDVGAPLTSPLVDDEDLLAAALAAELEPLTEPEEWDYTFDTNYRGGALESWAHLRSLVAEVQRDDDDFLVLESARTGRWGQTRLRKHGLMLVELSTDGWVDKLCSRRPGGWWTPDQAEAILRLWVSRRFQRADAHRRPVPRP